MEAGENGGLVRGRRGLKLVLFVHVLLFALAPWLCVFSWLFGAAAALFLWCQVKWCKHMEHSRKIPQESIPAVGVFVTITMATFFVFLCLGSS